MSYRYVTIAELRREARKARRRDWAVGAGSAVGGYLVGKTGSRHGPAPTAAQVRRRIHLGTAALLLAALLAAAWPYLLALAVLVGAVTAWRWHHARTRPVPWDLGYRAEDDPLPHERRWSQRDDDDGIPF